MRRQIGRSPPPGQRSPRIRLEDRKPICSGKPQVDGIDAAVLAHFAEMMRPEPGPLPDAASRELSAAISPMTSTTTRNGNASTVQTKLPVALSELECPESLVVVFWRVFHRLRRSARFDRRVSCWPAQPSGPIVATSTSVGQDLDRLRAKAPGTD
jgi:hypothetical protein